MLPGECLASTELTYYTPNSDGQQAESNRFKFGFTVNLSGHAVEKTDPRPVALVYRDVPSAEMYDSFGPNRESVKNEFERVFEEFSRSYSEHFQTNGYSIVTILYNGGISLVADKEFAGHPAGEDLGSLITCSPMYDSLVKESGEDPVVSSAFNTPSQAGGLLDLPLDYVSLIGDSIGSSIPMDGHELVKEPVRLELNIPVKVVYYLAWLNKRISGIYAPVPCKDEVLHCSFTTVYGLK